MTYEYLTPESPEAFVDFPEKKKIPFGEKECPVCSGHGGWNLRLNAYRLHNFSDTPENRHRFSHFRAVCSHCNGWGHVSKKEMCQGHKWERVKNVGKCLNLFRCLVCGKEEVVDSSD